MNCEVTQSHRRAILFQPFRQLLISLIHHHYVQNLCRRCKLLTTGWDLCSHVYHDCYSLFLLDGHVTSHTIHISLHPLMSLPVKMLWNSSVPGNIFLISLLRSPKSKGIFTCGASLFGSTLPRKMFWGQARSADLGISYCHHDFLYFSNHASHFGCFWNWCFSGSLASDSWQSESEIASSFEAKPVSFSLSPSSLTASHSCNNLQNLSILLL